ncbi:MAG: response regulator, partial [Sulfuricella sp.]|nr:response regulator [Sulfuricella sp.]
DVSERVAALHEQEVRLRSKTMEMHMSEARTRAILRTMLDGLVQIAPDGTILEVNDAIVSTFGYEHEGELLGQNVSMLMPEPYRASHDAHLQRYLHSREPHILGRRRELQGIRKDGVTFAIELMVNEMVDDAGSTFIGIIRDITEQKIALMVMHDALVAAQEASEARSRFLANMSHEIRTPINAVVGFAQLALHLHELPDLARRHLEKINAAAESLLGVVNDILDFSKIEAGKLEMEYVPFSLDGVLSRVTDLFSIKAREKGVELAVAASPGVPRRLLGDPLRLAQVLTNLVGNAIKFTSRGEIDVLVELEVVNEGQATLIFTVMDTGIGMTPTQLAHVFSPFTQADNSTTRKFGGTGLGLVISNQLIERMAGQISVESTFGEGSTFRFTARFGLDTSKAVAAYSPLQNKRVLILEDNAIMRTLLMQTLTSFGCWTEALASGEEALTRIASSPDVDAVIMDWHLPGMDGLETARQLRSRGVVTPFILVTGDDPESARMQDQFADFQAYLGKPVGHSTLHDVLFSLFGGESKGRRKHASLLEKHPDLAGFRILLVDDNDLNRQVGTELIRLTGAVVETAEDGALAVEAVQQRHFDLVLMDIQMPVMDGYTAARTLRARYPDLPVVALTAHAMIEEKARVIEAGMNDIITKPILPDVLFSTLARFLTGEHELRQAQPPGEAVQAELRVARCHDALSLDGVEPQYEILSVEVGMMTANGDTGFYARMLQMFLHSPTGDMGSLQILIEHGDLAGARRQAHSLKGMAASIGAKPLQSVMLNMEALLKEERATEALALFLKARDLLVATKLACEMYLGSGPGTPAAHRSG